MTYQQRYISSSVSMTTAFGRCIGGRAFDGLVLALQGDLGTGKTHLAQGIAGGMGIHGTIASPTFTLLNDYVQEDGLSFHHFDVYRLEHSDELEGIGFYDYGTEGVTLVEWADRFPEDIWPHAIWIRLERTGADTERVITVSVPERQIAWWKGVEADVVGAGYVRTDLDGCVDGR